MPSPPAQDFIGTVQSPGNNVQREKDLFQSTLSASGLVAASGLCLTFFFPKCTCVHTELVSQPLWSRAVEVLQDMTLSQTVLGTDMIQSSETALKHNCQQIAFTWLMNSQRAAHKIASSGVLLTEEREGTERLSVQGSSCSGKHLIHNTMGTVTSMRSLYLSYDIWDGGTSH